MNTTEQAGRLTWADKYASQAGKYASQAAKATQQRNRAIVRARDAGSTWRVIAEAVGLTEVGVRKIYERTVGK